MRDPLSERGEDGFGGFEFPSGRSGRKEVTCLGVHLALCFG
jgi:hypothetical protein